MSAYKLDATTRAARDLRSLPRDILPRIDSAIRELSENPRPPGSKKLTGSRLHRIRVGDYRVLYEIDDANRIVTLTKAGHRRDIYE